MGDGDSLYERKRSSLWLIEKSPYWGKVLSEEGKDPIRKGAKSYCIDRAPIPKMLYAYTRNTFSLYAKWKTFKINGLQVVNLGARSVAA